LSILWSSNQRREIQIIEKYKEEDAQYIGLCKKFPYLSGFGDTTEEALKEIKEVVEFSIEWMKEEGEELPKEEE
jgi:predicted RNase H-like HicB family nuclease